MMSNFGDSRGPTTSSTAYRSSPSRSAVLSTAAASLGRNHHALVSGSASSSWAIRSYGTSVATVRPPRHTIDRPVGP